MNEFWRWVLVVTLITALLSGTFMVALYVGKLVRKAEVILQRAEQLEKRKKLDKE